MRTIIRPELTRGRVRQGPLASDDNAELFGAFHIQGPTGAMLQIVSSAAFEQFTWEHVSVSLKNRCPTWEEMCFVKNLFWSEDEVVIQIHPAKKDYINHHPYCLHLWRSTVEKMPLPPKIMVGPSNG